jgi:lysozyme
VIASPRQINVRGLALVRHFESLFLSAYWDATGKCWTIGYGHTGLQHKDGTVYEGRKITRSEAERLLAYDMHQFESRVAALTRTLSLNDDQFSALVSFDFNTGGLSGATLLRLLNAKDFDGAALQFRRWNRSGGRVLNGLTRRRFSEERLFRGRADYIVSSEEFSSSQEFARFRV